MRKRNRFVVPFLLFGVSLAFGIWLGFRILVSWKPPPTATPTPDEHQRSILVVGVDRARTSGARLQALWYIVYVSGKANLTFVPLYPESPTGDEAESQELVKAFRFTPEGRPDPGFIRTVQSLFDLEWNSTVVVDDIGMIEIVDLAGGVRLNGDTLRGAIVIGGIPPAWEDPQSALQGQANLIAYLCENPPTQPAHEILSQVVALMPEHLHMEIEPEYALEEWQNLVSIQSRFQCDFPSLKGLK